MNELIETFEITQHVNRYPSKYIQLIEYNLDTPVQYFELRFDTGQLVNIHNTKRYKYSQDAFKAILTNFSVKRR